LAGPAAPPLRPAGHGVPVSEAGSRPGGHADTVRVALAATSHWVDTGFSVFNDRNYPRFERLLERLGVATQPTSMSFGVSSEDGAFEYASTSPNGLFATRANLVSPRFHRMLRDVVRFQREARALLTSD